ncbi:MAG: helix-turn-helix domain-containing protein [Blautia sp.]
MILADKIIEERKRNGWSQEELADKLSVSRQAVSKWESARSTPDLARVIQLAELFGVTTDELLRDELEIQDAVLFPKTTVEVTNRYKVSLEEANDYLNLKKRHSSKLAGAVSLCILSPVVLIFLAGFSDSGKWNITEGFVVGAGMTILLGFIALAVYQFISMGIKEQRFEYLEKECFETEYGVTGLIREKQKNYENTYTRGIAFGVVLCILSALPLIVAGAMEQPNYVYTTLTSLLLVLVAAGTYSIINVSVIKGSYDTLLQEGEYSVKEKKAKHKTNAFESAYWCLATAIYLGWSFLTMNWRITWIIWPVAGVLYGAISAIIRGIMKVEE